MVEYNNLDDVGQGYDLVQFEENAIAYTLGRHTNDYMTSFYANTPSGFFVESGWVLTGSGSCPVLVRTSSGSDRFRF